jgi:hypothetical protein
LPTRNKIKDMDVFERTVLENQLEILKALEQIIVKQKHINYLHDKTVELSLKERIMITETVIKVHV